MQILSQSQLLCARGAPRGGTDRLLSAQLGCSREQEQQMQHLYIHLHWRAQQTHRASTAAAAASRPG